MALKSRKNDRRSAIAKSTMDLLSYSFNAAVFSFQVRDKAYSTMDANGAGKAKYLQV